MSDTYARFSFYFQLPVSAPHLTGTGSVTQHEVAINQYVGIDRKGQEEIDISINRRQFIQGTTKIDGTQKAALQLLFLNH